MPQIPINGFYSGSSQKLSDRRCVNLTPILQPKDSLSPYALECPSGISDAETTSSQSYNLLSTGEMTGQIFEAPSNYRTGGVLTGHDKYIFNFYSDNGGRFHAKYHGFQGGARLNFARFASNGIYSVMVAKMSNSTKSAKIDRAFNITDLNIDNVLGLTPSGIVDIAYLGGRFIYAGGSEVGSTARRCFYSDIGQAAPNRLSFFAPDADMSEITGVMELNGRILMFTKDATYTFQLTADVDEPFRWNRAATIPVGLLNAQCKDTFKGSAVILGRMKNEAYRVYVLSGSGAQPISNKAIDYQINKELKQVDRRFPRVFTYQQKGRDYSCVQVGAFAFCYDHDAKVWHERRSGTDEQTDRPWDVIGYAVTNDGTPIFVGKKVTVANGNKTIQVGVEQENIAKDFGEEHQRWFTSAPFNAENQQMVVSELEAQTELDDSATPVEPLSLELSVSKDFGYTFESPEQQTVSRSGRARFFGLGRVEEAFVLKFKASGKHPVKILRLLTRLRQGFRT